MDDNRYSQPRQIDNPPPTKPAESGQSTPAAPANKA
jgi:hypothetical protein